MTRSRNKKPLPYKVIGAFDTETTNIGDVTTGYKAFFTSYQLGLLKKPIQDITPENVFDNVDVSLYRKCEDLYKALNKLVSSVSGFVPVIMVHNLGFDAYALAEWLNVQDHVKILAKTSTKPITITVCDELKAPKIVFWDTVSFYAKSLASLGAECGVQKLVGDWDYTLVRAPTTPLTESEKAYAIYDIYSLIAYTSYYLSKNPDIHPDQLGRSVVTKTGAVRAKRRVYFDQLKGIKGKYNAGRTWMFQNRSEKAKTDEELFTMHAATRGGFTFCAREHASEVYSGRAVASFDATSQHPGQMCSHYVPQYFERAEIDELQHDAEIISNVSMTRILKRWEMPFSVAFNACFEFENLRPKAGSLFEKHGIFPLASARVGGAPVETYDNDSNLAFRNEISARGFRDQASGATFAFGKLEAAERVRLWLTELSFWEVCQAYDFDSFQAISGFDTLKFCKPTDFSLLSVMRFYKAKNIMKEAMAGRANYNELRKYFPKILVDKMEDGTADRFEVKAAYGGAKAELNALFGIEATNESRLDLVFDTKDFIRPDLSKLGLENYAKNPKAWYQFGQRIVGWSRIAQMCAIQLVGRHVKDIIAGDTDSLKVHGTEKQIEKAAVELERIGHAVDRGKFFVMERVKRQFPQHFDPLKEIGYYVHEWTVSDFCASWNKSYIRLQDGEPRITIAGINSNGYMLENEDGTTSRISLENMAASMLKAGNTFEDVANVILGYNTTIDFSIIHFNERSAPAWGSRFVGEIVDHMGKKRRVNAPAAIALYPSAKTIGDTSTPDNARNVRHALNNNPLMDDRPKTLFYDEERKQYGIEHGEFEIEYF